MHLRRATPAPLPLLLTSDTKPADYTDLPVHRSISSHELMAGERVIIIRHGGDEYRLRITAADRLILTK